MIVESIDNVVLVDESDNEVGVMEKLEAHQLGLLHRAFSAFVFNSEGQMLLQQRAFSKYHSMGLWSNACCSHPRVGESLPSAAKRRMQEEMGFECDVEKAFDFIYRAPLENDLTEHELDHVLIGQSDCIPNPVASEVASWRYASINDIRTEIKNNPGQFTVWFKLCFEQVATHISQKDPLA